MEIGHGPDLSAPHPRIHRGRQVAQAPGEYLSGSSAFQNIRRLLFPSIVLLDVELPGKSGLKNLEWIRKQPKFAGLSVVMLSAAVDPGPMKRAYERGVNSYLAKPTGFEALVDLIVTLKRYWGTMNQAPGP